MFTRPGAPPSPDPVLKRRKFLRTSLAALAGTTFLARPLAAAAAGIARSGEGSAGLMESQGDGLREDFTIRQVIDLILADIPGAPFGQTVDTVKAGNINQSVKGIVTTMFATDAIIQKAIQLGANFIIAHEPTFYSHTDETDWLKNDRIFISKKDLLDKHGIVVWRFHDYWHSNRPDGILMGVLTALGWEKLYNPAEPNLLMVPPITMGDLIKKTKRQLGVPKVKAIGSLTQSCQKIVLSPGAAGGREQIGLLQKYRPDLLIVGELNEWETSEYIRDARFMGSKMSLLVLGHSVSEEPGMQWLVPWLKPKIPGVTVTHLPSGDPFMWV